MCAFTYLGVATGPDDAARLVNSDAVSVRVSARLLTAVALVVTLTRVADAQDSTKRARAEFHKGVRAAERGDYTRALRHYQESNRIHPHPRTLYNLAAVAEHLQREEEAYEAYQSFIASATPSEDDLLPEARRKVAALALRLQAMLAVTTTPPGARIFV